MAVHGVHTCKSPLCPLCAPKWQRTRSDEISQAIDGWPLGPDGVFFVTLTMKHNRKMLLVLQQRLLTQAFGNLWSGNQGAKASFRLGGKPESIRAHDRTWSRERGWHPHIHALLFVDNADLSTSELAALLDVRWPKVLGAALRRFRRLCQRIVTRSDAIDDNGAPSGRGGCGRPDCAVCQVPYQGPRQEWLMQGPLRFDEETRKIWRAPRLGSYALPAAEQRGECSHFRERAARLFGVRLFPRVRRERVGTSLDGKPLFTETVVPIHDSALRVIGMLDMFTPQSIQPTRAHGAFVERMRSKDRLPNYLAKLGLELTSTDKTGKVGSDGIVHYSVRGVAELACGSTKLREPARRAYGELFRATIGTQTITFSDREALGLPDDPYAEGQEPAEQAVNETSRAVGQIIASVYREQVVAKEHALLSELADAYARGTLFELGYVDPPDMGRPLRRVPEPRGPPSTAADPTAVDGNGYLIERPELGAPADVSLAERLESVAARGETPIGRAYRDATALPSGDTSLPEQLRKRLRDAIGKMKGDCQ